MKPSRILPALLLSAALLFTGCAPALPSGGETEDGSVRKETEPTETERTTAETEPGTQTEPPESEFLPDLSAVSFDDGVFLADGTAHSLAAKGLPSGVTAEYDGNGKTEPGTYTVTARFFYGGAPIGEKTATLTVCSDRYRVGPAYFTDDGYETLLYLDPALADAEYRVPDGTVGIAPGAFASAGITTLVLPASVTEIGEYAFGFRLSGGTARRVSGFSVKGTPGSAAETYCRENGIPFSEAEAPLTFSSPADLYARDGLTLLLCAYRGASGADPAAGVWHAELGASATLEGGAFGDGNPTGWRIGDDGGLYYRIQDMPAFRASRATTGIVLSPDALQNGGAASDFTVETVFVPLGISGDDGVLVDHYKDLGNPGYSQYGAYAGSRSTFAFAGLQMCFFHYSTAPSGNSMRTRIFYQSDAWERGDAVGGGSVMSNTTYGDYVLFTAAQNVSSFPAGTQFLRVCRQLSPADDYTRSKFTVTTPYATVEKDNGGKPYAFYETAQLPHPFEMFFAFPARVYAIRAYDRVLTTEETTRNHFADLCLYFDLDLSPLSGITEADLPSLCAAFRGFDFTANADALQAILDTAKDRTYTYRLTLRCEAPDGTLLRDAEYAVAENAAYHLPSPTVPGYVTRTFFADGTMAHGATVTLRYFPVPGESLPLPDVVCLGGDTAAAIGCGDTASFASLGLDPAALGSSPYGAGYAAVLQSLIRSRIGSTHVLAFGVRGEDTATVASRVGTEHAGVSVQESVLVAPGATVTLRLSQTGNGILRQGDDDAVNPVTIAGQNDQGRTVTVTGILTVTSDGYLPQLPLASLTYSFTRTDDGKNSVLLPAGARVVTSASTAARGAWLVLFADEHGGYDTPDELVALLREIVAATDNDGHFLVVGPVSGTEEGRAALDGALAAAFGDRYCNPRVLLHDDTAPALGIPARYYADAAISGTVPTVFLQDPSHLNALGQTALAHALFDRICTLGWFDGFFDALEASWENGCFAPEDR